MKRKTQCHVQEPRKSRRIQGEAPEFGLLEQGANQLRRQSRRLHGQGPQFGLLQRQPRPPRPVQTLLYVAALTRAPVPPASASAASAPAASASAPAASASAPAASAPAAVAAFQTLAANTPAHPEPNGGQPDQREPRVSLTASMASPALKREPQDGPSDANVPNLKRERSESPTGIPAPATTTMGPSNNAPSTSHAQAGPQSTSLARCMGLVKSPPQIYHASVCTCMNIQGTPLATACQIIPYVPIDNPMVIHMHGGCNCVSLSAAQARRLGWGEEEEGEGRAGQEANDEDEGAAEVKQEEAEERF